MVFSILTLLAFQPDAASLRRIFEDSLAKKKTEFGLRDQRTALAARDLGLFLIGEGDRPAAAQALAEAVTIDEFALGPQADRTLSGMLELATVSAPEDAERLLRKASASKDPAVASRAFDKLGSLREAAQDRAGAAANYRLALAKEEAASGVSGARVAVRLNSLALAIEPRSGIPLLQRALTINRKVYGPKHPETASTEANLCGLLFAVGRVSEAVRMGRQALAAFEATLQDNPRTAGAASNLADAVWAMGDPAGAEQLYRRALEIDRSVYGPMHEETKVDARKLAWFLREEKRASEAGKVEADFGIQPVK